jgi:secretion/DNA translocation related CpaE-like protein
VSGTGALPGASSWVAATAGPPPFSVEAADRPAAGFVGRSADSSTGAAGAAVVAVTAQPWVADRVAALAAAAGVPLRSLTALPPGWSHRLPERLVLLGPDVDPAGERRGGVVLVCDGEPGPDVWRGAVQVGAEQVTVLPEGEPWLLDRMVDAVSPPGSGTVIGVIGGRGGAGASTLAVGLATAAARARVRTLLVDTDPLGGGLDLLVGAEQEGGLRWSDLAGARGRLQPGLLASMLPGSGDLCVLTWERGRGPLPEPWSTAPGPAAVDAVLSAAVREFDLTVVDLSRRFAETDTAALRACTVVYLIVPAEVRATAAAAAVCARLDELVADQRLVVRGPAPTGLPADAVAEALELPLAGELRPEPAVAAALDRGEPLPSRPRGALATLCRRLLAEVLAR